MADGERASGVDPDAVVPVATRGKVGFVYHKSCGADLTVHRVYRGVEGGALVLWCPTCAIEVESRDASSPGPYSLG